MTETIHNDSRFAEQDRKRIVLEGYSSPENAAPLAVSFVTQDVNYVTAQSLNVYGGADIHL